MSLIPHEFIYRGDLSAIGPFHSQVFVDALAGGEIVSIYVEAEGVSGFSGDWFIGLQKNGVDILTAAERPQITAMDLEVEVTGLSEAVSFRDRLTPTIDERGAGTITGPITVIVWIRPTEKTTPVDADTVAITDSAASNATKRLSWANIKATLVTYLNTLYVTLAGDQTIGGVKTFSSSPIVPTPTNATDVANKDYVDSSGGAAALADLTDVDFTVPPATGTLLVFDGLKWIADYFFGNNQAKIGLDDVTQQVILGDVDGTGNNTTFIVDDDAEVVTSNVPIVVPADPYDATGWDGNNEVATKGDIRDKIEALIIGGGGYTDEQAQDAVGGILTDSSEIDFSYNDGAPSITASIVAGSIDESKLDASVNASLDLADSSVQPATAATLSAKKIQLDPTLGADDTFEGLSIPSLNNSGGVTQWDAVLLNGSSQWILADANGSGTYPALGLAASTETTGNPVDVIVFGSVRNDAWNWTPGGLIYLSTTAGGLTQAAPSSSGDKVQVVGVALNADTMFVNPQLMYITIT